MRNYLDYKIGEEGKRMYDSKVVQEDMNELYTRSELPLELLKNTRVMSRELMECWLHIWCIF